MKKKVSLLLALITVITVCFAQMPGSLFAVSAESPSSGTCGKDGDNVTWALDSEGTMTISGTGEMQTYVPDMATPWEGQKDKIKKVIISEGITLVGGYTFMDNDTIKSVKIADSVTKIDWFAFRNCTALESVEIGKGVTTIWYEVFSGCTSLKKIVLPEALEFLGQEAFQDCTSLSDITIYDNITTIGNSAFDNTAFMNDKSNYEDGVLYLGKYLIKSDNTLLASDYTVKDGTLVIAGGAFWNYTDHKIECPLKKLTIPGSVKTIGFSSFSQCSLLEEVELGSGVAVIENCAFEDCPLLKEIIIPDSVKNVGSSAFRNCKGLKNVKLGKGITDIGWGAFMSCTSLETVDLSECAASIGQQAFYYCIKLVSVNFGNNTKRIDSQAFEACASLKDVSIGTGVVEIYYRAFYGTPFINDSSNYKSGILYIGNHLIAAVNSDDHKGSYEIKDGTTDIAQFAFDSCRTINTLIVPDSVKYIGSNGNGRIRVIFCNSGSYAESYAKENNVEYHLIDKEILTNSKIHILDGFIYNVFPGTSYDDFKGFFLSDVTVRDRNGEEISSGNIGTGTTVHYGDLSAAVVIFGDTDGNGKIDSTDYIIIKRHFLRLFSLEGAYFKAADIDCNEKINSTDYIAIKRYILGLGSL